MSLREIRQLLMGSIIGKSGVIMLGFLIVISIYVVLSYPSNFGREVWSNPGYWADNPKSVPPSWSNIFPGNSGVKHNVLFSASPTHTTEMDNQRLQTFALPLNFNYHEFPTFLSFSLSEVEYHSSPPRVSIFLKRPDGRSPLLLRHILRGPRDEEAFPIHRYYITPMRVVLSNNPNVINNLSRFHNGISVANFSIRDLSSKGSEAAFGIVNEDNPGEFQILSGPYEFIVEVLTYNEKDSIGSIQIVVGGSVYGVMGTDSLGRDLAIGLLFGFPVALVIGFLASTLTTGIGTLLGILSGYYGGWIDLIIQRIADVVANIPVLPILIFLVFIFGSNLWLIILVLVAFSWPGLTILIRSMVLQIRTSQIIEASHVLGASNKRIMFRHILPQTAPFVFAQMIFFTPAAILAEAGLSFLGLGDPSIPTWGQILEQGFRTGAVYQGYWWWIMPPGLLIMVTAVTFAFLALALEPMVNPKLRKM